MATLSIGGLQERMRHVGIETTFAQLPDSNPLTRPIDIYRVSLATKIASIINNDASVAYNALHSCASLELGDLVLTLPQLRVRDVGTAELSREIAKNVSFLVLPHGRLIYIELKIVIAGTYVFL